MHNQRVWGHPSVDDEFGFPWHDSELATDSDDFLIHFQSHNLINTLYSLLKPAVFMWSLFSSLMIHLTRIRISLRWGHHPINTWEVCGCEVSNPPPILWVFFPSSSGLHVDADWQYLDKRTSVNEPFFFFFCEILTTQPFGSFPYFPASLHLLVKRAFHTPSTSCPITCSVFCFHGFLSASGRVANQSVSQSVSRSRLHHVGLHSWLRKVYTKHTINHSYVERCTPPTFSFLGVLDQSLSQP